MARLFNQFLVIAFAILLFAACKGDDSKGIGDDIVSVSQKSYLDQPNKATANAYLNVLRQKLSQQDIAASQKKYYLSEGIKVANEQGLKNSLGSFLFPYIRDNIKEEGIENKIFELAELMKSLNKNAASNILYKGLIDMYPSYKSQNEIVGLMSESINSSDDYIAKIGESIFSDPDEKGINRKSALQYVDVCEAYSLVYPESTATPELLFKAAEVAKSIQTFPKSLSIYDWMIKRYPNYEKTPTAMFLKAFIIENNLGNDSLALVCYNEFITKYPDDDLVDDAEFLLNNIGKTDEEILQMIEKKRQENQQ